MISSLISFPGRGARGNPGELFSRCLAERDSVPILASTRPPEPKGPRVRRIWLESKTGSVLGGRYMGFHSQRILAQAGFSGVTFAAKILRCELPRYWLPRAEFAANVIPCSAPLMGHLTSCSIVKQDEERIDVKFCDFVVYNNCFQYSRSQWNG